MSAIYDRHDCTLIVLYPEQDPNYSLFIIVNHSLSLSSAATFERSAFSRFQLVSPLESQCR